MRNRQVTLKIHKLQAIRIFMVKNRFIHSYHLRKTTTTTINSLIKEAILIMH